MSKRLMVSSGIQFDPIDKLTKEAQSILDSVSKQVNLKIGKIDISNLDKSIDTVNKKIISLNKNNINLGGTSLNKTLDDLSKIAKEVQGVSKYKVELMSDGQAKIITNVNNQLKETVRTVKNLANGDVSISISGDIDKNKKAVYSEIASLQKTEYDLKMKLLSADGEYANVLKQQIQYAQELSNATKSDIDKTNLSDATLYNNILKERSSLEDKLNREKAKIDTTAMNKASQEILKQNEYLDKTISKLKAYKDSLNSSGNLKVLKPSDQASLNKEITKQISNLEDLKNQNTLLGNAEKDRINSTVGAIRTQTNELTKYGTSFSSLLKKIGGYALGGSLIYSGIGEIKKGIGDIVNLDSALRDLAKVSNLTKKELGEFASVANGLAKEIGTSTEEIIKASEYYSRLGYSISEAAERAKNATIFKNVGDFSSIDEASKALITISKGFDLNSLEDMVRIMDVANSTGNAFSSSTKDVADGIMKMGNALSEAGNSYEQAVGLFVAGNASIQDADVVGNSIKTISINKLVA